MTRRLARIAAVLLTATAALFVVGVMAEANRTTPNESSETHVESGNESGEISGSATAEAGPSEATETVLGISVESPATAMRHLTPAWGFKTRPRVTSKVGQRPCCG